MIVATHPSDGRIGVNAPDRQHTELSATTSHPTPLNVLRRLALLDTPAEEAFDRLTRLAAKIMHAPVALLSLVDGDRSFFKSNVGLPEPWASRREMPLSHSVCQHVVALSAPLVINDARADPLISDNQAVTDRWIAAYLGIPLITFAGQAIGTFAVIDTVPREWTPDDVTTLGDLAASAMTEIELRAEANQRLRVEQRLNLMESVVANASVAVLIAEADPTGPFDPRIVFVNDAYTHLTGYSPDEVVGSTYQILNNSVTDRTQIDTVRSALATSNPARLEFLSHRKDGSAFWAESNIIPITDRAGRYSHWVVIQRDISKQKAAEKAVRESEEQFRVLAEAIPQIVWTARPDGWIDYYNQRWFDYTGLTLEQSRGWGWELALHPDDLKDCLDHWSKSVRTGEVYEIKYRFKRAADATYRWHLGRALPLRDDLGKIAKWFGTSTDITELKEAEVELREAKETAEAANRAKSDFFSRMSHELRTPLNVILGFSQLLELEDLSDPQRESAEQIRKGGRQLLALINEVLDIARIEAGGTEVISLEEVAMGEVVEEVVRMIQPLASQAGVRLLPPQLATGDCAVHADRQRLKQVLLNLLSNGIKYNRPGGTVAVSCAISPGTRLRISVTDTGLGIAQEKMHRLFAPFDRLEAEQKGVEGTGLGLTLSKGLVEAMQGQMGAESTVGEGTTFWLELPRIDQTSERTCGNPATVVDTQERPVAAGKVLDVEDNHANFRLVEFSDHR